MSQSSTQAVWVALMVLLPVLHAGKAATDAAGEWRRQLEDDWVRQAEGASATGLLRRDEDAAGGCDGAKDGGIGFHTQHESRPWWRVDLGATHSLARVLLWNRTNHPVTPARGRHIVLLLSEDGEHWREAYRHDGSVFFGHPDGNPLTVDLRGATARFVKVQLADTQYLHLDEVEVFGAEPPGKNLALDRPATQSSASQWSTPPRRPLPKPERDSAFWRAASTKAMGLAEATLEFVGQSIPCPTVASELAALRLGLTRAGVDTNWKSRYHRIRHLRRRVILSHPLLQFDRLLVNRRPPPVISHMVDQYLGRWSRPGPGLTVVTDWRRCPRPAPLVRPPLPTGSVLHPDLSSDAKRVIFSCCDHTVAGLTDEETRGCEAAMGVGGLFRHVKTAGRRRFAIYEVRIADGAVRRLTGGRRDPLHTRDGRRTVLVEDFDPCYLPGGGFVFVSTRCQSFGRCHWGRYTPTFVLYRADADGSNIRRISHGELNEWDPAVLADGRLLFCRWDYVNRHNTFFQSLWTGRTDGTGVAHLYGNNSRNPCMTSEARAVPGLRQVVCTATAHHSYTAGSIILVDPDRGQDGLDPIERITPEVRFPETEGWSRGSYATPFALSRDLFLAAYSPDRLPASWQPKNAPRLNGYGIYLVDTLGGRELIFRDPTMSSFAPIPIRPRPSPPVLPGCEAAPGGWTGTFVLQDAYCGSDGQEIKPRTVRRLRVVRLHPQPSAGVPHRSIVGAELVKSVVGTTELDLGGSAVFEAPAGVPLMFQLLDENGMAVMTMRGQTHLQPGETLACIGCHEPRQSAPPLGNTIRGGARKLDPPAGPNYPGGFSFVRTVQPVLDRYCIGCHGLQAKEAGLSLLGTPTARFNVAYEALIGRKGLVALMHANRESDVSRPEDYYARRGRLPSHLLGPHRKRVALDPESFQRIVDWLDLNAQYYGDYSWNRLERRLPSVEGERALREHLKGSCGACHAGMAARPLAALVNLAIPEESRAVKAPLARAAGGWELCTGLVWTRSARGHTRMLDKARAVVAPAEASDVAGACGRVPCRCGGCWVRRLRQGHWHSRADARSQIVCRGAGVLRSLR